MHLDKSQVSNYNNKLQMTLLSLSTAFWCTGRSIFVTWNAQLIT